MTLWIADYEIEAHLSLPNDSKVKFTHPGGDYEIHIKNLNTEPGTELPLLSVQVIFECANIAEAPDISKEHLKLFLDILTFVTNSKFKIHSLVRIIDWTPGLSMRDCHQFKGFPADDLPYPLLEDLYLESVRVLLGHSEDIVLQRSLKWFSNGVGATYLDDQFQYFWFVMEILAEFKKDITKVPDVCPKCKNDLYCQTCGTTPTHRPYPKQAIQQLVEKIVTNKPQELFELINKVRNALMHGSDITEIEKTLPFTFAHLINVLGKVAWTAIRRSFNVEDHAVKLPFLVVSKYTHDTLVTKIVMQIGAGPDMDAPDIEAIPKVQLSMTTSLEESSE